MMLTSFDNFSFVKILSFLKTHRSEFLSGQDMSDILKISRVAVWKDIKKIRALGYKIESKQNIGYRLVDSSKLPLPWEIKEDLNTKFLGNRIYYFNTIDTTQNFAMKIASGKNEDGKRVQSTSNEETADMLLNSKQVIIVPGYGMAVAQAQYIIHEIAENLRKRNLSVKFAIHPVAGRLPGHMNVLLAEANLPYDIVFEMDEINSEFKNTDVVLVIGANDIVNPGALDDENSPIYGMPVLEVWDAKTVIVLKRSMATGYSGVGNPLYTRENTWMLFGDAKESLNKVSALLN